MPFRRGVGKVLKLKLIFRRCLYWSGKLSAIKSERNSECKTYLSVNFGFENLFGFYE